MLRASGPTDLLTASMAGLQSRHAARSSDEWVGKGRLLLRAERRMHPKRIAERLTAIDETADDNLTH
jgi:AraC-like DNA-binding protein